jgi:hypothetical protein
LANISLPTVVATGSVIVGTANLAMYTSQDQLVALDGAIAAHQNGIAPLPATKQEWLSGTEV